MTLTVSSAPSPVAQVGHSYSQSNVANGGVPPYTYSLASGALPPGVSLNTLTGEVSGTPTNVAPFSYVIQVADSTAPSAVTVLSSSVGLISASSAQPFAPTPPFEPQTQPFDRPQQVNPKPFDYPQQSQFNPTPPFGQPPSVTTPPPTPSQFTPFGQEKAPTPSSVQTEFGRPGDPAVSAKPASKPIFNRVGRGTGEAPEVLKRTGDSAVLIAGPGPINFFLGEDFVMGDVIEIYPDMSGSQAHTVSFTVPEGHLIFGAGKSPLVMRLGFRLHKLSDTEWGAIGS